MMQPARSRSGAALSRREFLQSSATCALAAGLGSAGWAGAAEARRPWVAATRDTHLRATGQPDCWSALKALEASGLEVVVNDQLACPGLFHPEQKYSIATPEGIKTLQGELAARGLTVTAFCMSNRLDERLEQEVEWARRLVAATQRFGVRAIRIDVVPRQTPAAQFLPFAIKACKQFCELVEATPVHFGIENHGSITNDPTFTEKLFDGVGSPHLGLTLDAMNFYWFGHPLEEVYQICEKFAGRVFHTHCKNLRYPEEKRQVRRPVGWEYEKHAAPLYDGDLDFGRVAAILRRANYQGDLCLENECLGRFPKDQHLPILKKEMALLKTLCA